MVATQTFDVETYVWKYGVYKQVILGANCNL